jgi:hypothetical protein
MAPRTPGVFSVSCFGMGFSQEVGDGQNEPLQNPQNSFSKPQQAPLLAGVLSPCPELRHLGDTQPSSWVREADHTLPSHWL